MLATKIKRTIALLFVVISLLAAPARTMAWGNKGHVIVAHIAFQLLSEGARNEVNDLLKEDETLWGVATWADGLRGSFDSPGVRPETPLWHFVDIPLNKEYDAARDCAETPNGSCAISALVIFQDTLAKKKSGYYSNSRYEALKFIVHFAGDIHQPLHCVDDNDFGGNTKKVVWIDQSILKLHGVWDDAILNENMKQANISGEIAYADFLFGKLTDQQKAAAKSTSLTPSVVSRSVIEGWARDAHVIANGAYADIGPQGANHRYTLTNAYYEHHRNEVDNQLMLAGVRLARILNENLK